MQVELLSIGVDVGTTTFHFVVNRLFVGPKAAGRGLPRYELRGFEEVCKSPVFFTPYTRGEAAIDEDLILELILLEFGRFDISPADVQTGSVIVTGEASRKENADRIIASLSGLFENLVSTVAGPKLESLLAAKGAQVDRRSKELFKTIVNVDIGGGTSNIGVFRNGKNIGLACLWIGGRMVRLDQEGCASGMTEAAQAVCEAEGLRACGGAGAEGLDVERFVDAVAGYLLDFIHSRPIPERLVEFDELPKAPWRYDEISFTGGVGQLMQGPACGVGGSVQFFDIGPLLAEKLKDRCISERVYASPIECIRATAIGVGVNNLQLSGGTVFASDPGMLPLRNVPAVNIEIDAFDIECIAREMELAEAPHEGAGLLAYYFKIQGALGYNDMAKLSELVLQRMRLAGRSSAIVVFNKDIGKIFGYHTANACRRASEVKILSVDGIELDDNTYLDFGVFLPGGALPVTAKTLYF